MVGKVSHWGARKQDDRVAKNADQTELVAVQYGSSNLEVGTYDDRIAESLDDYETASPTDTAAWAEKDNVLDNAISDIGIEIDRRQSILGKAYPFKLEGNRLIYNQSSTLVYEFCLALSVPGAMGDGNLQTLTVAFERLARDVVLCFLGPGSEGYRTGWPADKLEKRPSRFKKVVEVLNKKTSEWIWQPMHNMPDDPNPQDVKDEGLDFVVWKNIPDGRAGKLFMLGQCACGDNYGSKLNDIDPLFEKLKTWINPISYTTPMRVFATPRHIPNEIYFGKVNRDAGLTFDRTRLTIIAESGSASDVIVGNAKIPYEELIGLVVNDFSVE